MSEDTHTPKCFKSLDMGHFYTLLSSSSPDPIQLLGSSLLTWTTFLPFGFKSPDLDHAKTKDIHGHEDDTHAGKCAVYRP